MNPEDGRKMFMDFVGKAGKATAEAKKAAAKAKKMAEDAKKTAEGYMDIGNAMIAKGFEKVDEKGKQLDRVIGKVVDKFNEHANPEQQGVEKPVQQDAAKPAAKNKKPKGGPDKKGHFKI